MKFRILLQAILILSISISCKKHKNDNPGDQDDMVFLPINSEGWTEFSPSADSRIIYISEDGNDESGQVYNSEDFIDPFNPSEPVNAFATYTAAFAHAREGYPDWILFKRGEIFYESPGSDMCNGRGPEEPFLIGSYGDSGPSPLIKTGTGSAVRILEESPSSPDTSQYIAIQGLCFYAHTRNPEDSDFTGYGEAAHGIQISTYNEGNVVRNILIEGCGISFYRNNIIIQASGDAGSVTDIVVRRNTILHAYSVTSHSQGLYASGVNGLFIEENIFDHNGWLIQSTSNDRTNGGATFHNHNVYTDGVQNGTYHKNIFMRASSIGTKLQGNTGINGLVVDNNLYIDGEIGIESCNNYHDYYYRVHDPIISNNIFYEPELSNPTLRDVGWGMWIQGWDGGQINNNLMISHQGQMFFNLGLRSRETEIYNNTGLMTSMYGIYHTSEVELENISVHDNYFEKLSNPNDRLIVSEGASINGIQFSSNTYYSVNTLDFRINSDSYDPDQWIINMEANANFTKRSFPDPSRTIETYLESIGEEATIEHFIETCRSQERYHWDTRFVADNVNNWIREGYGMNYE